MTSSRRGGGDDDDDQLVSCNDNKQQRQDVEVAMTAGLQAIPNARLLQLY